MRSSRVRTVLLASGAAVALAATSGPAAADDLQTLRDQLSKLQSKVAKIEANRAVTARKVAAAAAVEAGDRPKSWKLPGTNTSMSIGGYVKLDLLWASSNGGNFAFGGQINGAAAAAAPPGNDGVNGGAFSLHARQSRIFIATTTPTDWGTLATRIEGDFFGFAGNAPLFRLRHAWGCLGPVCAGQTWSTFMPVWAGAETLDFGGAFSSIFVRHAQIRFTHSFGGGWVMQLAIEDPNGGAAFGSGGGDALAAVGAGVATAAAQQIPDFVAALFWNMKRGRLWVGGLLKQAENRSAPGLSDEELGYAVQVAGAFKIAKRLRAGFAGQWGRGYQGYLGNGTTANFVDAGGNITPVTGWGAYVWARWAWTDTIRSTVMWSYMENNHDKAVTKVRVPVGTTHWGQSVHVNLIWSPVPAVNIGIEYAFGHGGRFNANDAEYHGIQISFQYKF